MSNHYQPVPEGWRNLKHGEVIRKGDRFFYANNLTAESNVSTFGDKYDSSYAQTIRRSKFAVGEKVIWLFAIWTIEEVKPNGICLLVSEDNTRKEFVNPVVLAPYIEEKQMKREDFVEWSKQASADCEEMERQAKMSNKIEGVPEGYELVRIGSPKPGDSYLTPKGKVENCLYLGFEGTGYAIVRKIETPKQFLPFESAEEFMAHPLHDGWITLKLSSTSFTKVSHFDHKRFWVNGGRDCYTWEDGFNLAKFRDGSPFGVEVQDA